MNYEEEVEVEDGDEEKKKGLEFATATAELNGWLPADS